MKKMVLCIGINDYPGTSSDLSGCVNDANDWADILEKNGYSTTIMLDKKATGKAIRKAIASIVGNAVKGDRVIIQYSGHGSFVPDEDGDEADNTDECLCPYDIMTNGPITDDELFDLYDAKMNGVQVVMISDSCHSGTVAKFAPIVTPPSTSIKDAPRRRVRFLPPSVFLPKEAVNKLGVCRAFRASNPPGRYASLLLAGCQDTEYSYDACFNGRYNGAFSYVALSVLKKIKKGANFSQWFKEIREVLPSQQYPQRPNCYGSSAMKKWVVLK